MTAMTPELRRAIEEAGESPPRVVDPVTNTDYVLLRADVYERLRALIEPDDGLGPREISSLMWEAMKGDWDDPKMDDYDDYPEQGG
jgi:hypothetical protein